MKKFDTQAVAGELPVSSVPRMGWGELITAVVGVLIGVAATEIVHARRARIENPAIRLTVRAGSNEGACVLNNLGYASAHRVGVTAGRVSQHGRYRVIHPVKRWNEVPPGAELQFTLPQEVSRTGDTVLMVAWYEGLDPTARRRQQQWPIQ
ncbi:hypothetical protein [Streptomyces cadmiisoli]|uniref:hypothetical protein n=1 Tax=Streptomyces cadmiisoli TaxID=2184053 RepID=UPI003D73D828